MITRHPRIMDPVIVWGERGTIVLLQAGYAHIDRDDDIRTRVSTDRLRWVDDREAWVIIPAEVRGPEWLTDL